MADRGGGDRARVRRAAAARRGRSARAPRGARAGAVAGCGRSRRSSSTARWTVGAWFVSRRILRRREPGAGQSVLAWPQMREGLAQLVRAGARCWRGATSARPLLVDRRRLPPRRTHDRREPPLGCCVLALRRRAAALPLYAYFQGHPVRIRYDVPLVAACAALIGAGDRAAAPPRPRPSPACSSSRCARWQVRAVRPHGAGRRRIAARGAEHGGPPRRHRLSRDALGRPARS